MKKKYSLGKETKDMKNNQIKKLELKTTITEMQSSVDGFNSRTKKTEKSVGVHEDRTIVITQSEKESENRLEKWTEPCTYRIILKDLILISLDCWKETRKGGEVEKMFKETMTEDFSHFARDLNLQIQETRKTPNRTSERNSCQEAL